jgi:hypothetical protein
MTDKEALHLALEALEESKTNNDTMEFHDRKGKAITAIKQALSAPVQEPYRLDKEKPETDWDHVWLLIEAAIYASARGHMSGTTNWGSAMSAYLRHSTPPAQPAPVQELVAHCEAGPDYCQQCHKESLPTYGSEKPES